MKKARCKTACLLKIIFLLIYIRASFTALIIILCHHQLCKFVVFIGSKLINPDNNTKVLNIFSQIIEKKTTLLNSGWQALHIHLLLREGSGQL